MNITKWIIAAYCLVGIFASWQIIPAISTYRKTGTLKVEVSSSTAQLSISQDTSRAVIIGTGNTIVRLKPGIYQIAAVSDGTHSSAIVSVRKTQTTQISLDLSSTNTTNTPVRSVANINFSNTDGLINEGLTTNQLSELEQYFFQFKPSANSVTIDSSSVQTGPHNPNVDSPFTINFSVAVDAKVYSATVSYNGLNNIQLQLFDQSTGAQLFKAGTPNG